MRLCIVAIFLSSLFLISIVLREILKRKKKRFEKKNDSYKIKKYTFSPLFPSEEIMERAYEILNEKKE